MQPQPQPQPQIQPQAVARAEGAVIISGRLRTTEREVQGSARLVSSATKPNPVQSHDITTPAHITQTLTTLSQPVEYIPSTNTPQTTPATMADDTRKPEAQTPPPPRTPANIMPGGTAHTAGGEKADAAGPTYFEVVRNLGPEYYLNFHKRPCIRDSQLQGIAAGFAGGSLAAIIGSALFLMIPELSTMAAVWGWKLTVGQNLCS